MKTCCPHCLTVFRVTLEQLKVYVGNVRCGQCKKVFNALDNLIDDNGVSDIRPYKESIPIKIDDPQTILGDIDDEPEDGDIDQAYSADALGDIFRKRRSAAQKNEKPASQPVSHPPPPPPVSVEKWSDIASGYMEKPALSRRARLLYTLGLILLAGLLCIQTVFHFRNEIAMARPQLRPFLQNLSSLLGKKLYYPRDANLISIETSDLRDAPTENGQLILSATLRNRANYIQELPVIEFSLTDVQESVIARCILTPADYLPPNMSGKQLFEANADIPVQLWIETKDLDLTGYRLYVFYP